MDIKPVVGHMEDFAILLSRINQQILNTFRLTASQVQPSKRKRTPSFGDSGKEPQPSSPNGIGVSGSGDMEPSDSGNH